MQKVSQWYVIVNKATYVGKVIPVGSYKKRFLYASKMVELVKDFRANI